jgi:hypothetical protein
MRGTAPTSDPRFAYAVIAMLLGPSLVGVMLTVLVHGRAALRELDGVQGPHGLGL